MHLFFVLRSFSFILEILAFVIGEDHKIELILQLGYEEKIKCSSLLVQKLYFSSES